MPKEVIESAVNGTLTVGWDDKNAQIGVDLGNKFQFSSDKSGEEFTGLWVTLTTRDDFNRAIKALRRARDTVHGKDA